MDPKIDKYLDTNIKDIINEFNGVQQALDSFEIGCAPCGLGTCKLRDVVGIHNLNAENEKKLFDMIFTIIYPGEVFEIPRLGQDKVSTSGTAALSPPLRILVEEHNLIKRVLALVPIISQNLDVSNPEHKQMVAGIVDFIRSYADKFHHAKEEDILFKYFDSSLDIINVMVSDHVHGRSFVANALQAAESGDNQLVKENLANYANLLTEHIHKEDTILYPWMDKNLQTRQVGEMYTKFFDVNNANPGIQAKYEAFVISLETKFL